MAKKICYFPNQAVAEADTPCNESADVSHCCDANSICFNNGYCMSQPPAGWGNRLARSSCTDATFKDPRCPQHCTTAFDSQAVALQLVDGPSTAIFCCVGQGNSSRCAISSDETTGYQPFPINNGAVIWDRQTGQTNLTLAAQSTPTVEAPSSPGSGYVRIGTAVGAGVGSSLGLLLITAVFVLLYRVLLKSKPFKLRKTSPNGHIPDPYPTLGLRREKRIARFEHELEYNPVSELGDNR